MPVANWWIPGWTPGGELDPDAGWPEEPAADEAAWVPASGGFVLTDETVLAPLEAQLGQVRSRDRVRDLAEVFTHQGEVDAILNQMPDAFAFLDVKFLEPACGSGNFLIEILRRKLHLVTKRDCTSQERYEHRLLRAVASIYGVDISCSNVTEARGRMAHVLLEHYATDANTVEPTVGFLSAAALILEANIVFGDTLNDANSIELCDWQPRSRGCFQRVWSAALVPVTERNLFWAERIQDDQPVHYSQLAPTQAATKPARKKTRSPK